MNEILSSFFGDSQAYFNGKSLTFELTFVNKDKKLVRNYWVNIYILCNIKLHFFWKTGYLSLNSWLANEPLSELLYT